MMKQFSQFLGITLCAIFLIGSITSCEKDPVRGCTNVASENYNSNAEEDDGSCIFARDKFLGNYQVNEVCLGQNFTYTMAITVSSSDLTKIVMANLGSYNENVVATVSGNNVTINNTQGVYTFSGTGSISGSTLTLNYSTSSGGVSEDCVATCVKQ